VAWLVAKMTSNDPLADAAMRKTSKQQAIRNAFFGLGLHAKTKQVVQALEQLGVQVDDEFVRLVRIELLKKITGRKPAKNSRVVGSAAVRRYSKEFPRRRGNG
jgi:hypothetical protein